MARNPATGEQVRVKAKRVARITPLKNFKDAVLSGKASEARGQEDGCEENREEGPGAQAGRQEGPGQEGSGQEDCEARTGARARGSAESRGQRPRVGIADRDS